jgi:hypothetical protein
MLGAGAALIGCRDVTDSVVCAGILKYAVELRVLDARTGATVVAPRGAIREGSFVDSLESAFAIPGTTDTTVYPWRAGAERPGNYALEVVADGYRPWALQLVVGRDACGVVTQQLTARLAPRSP